MSQIWDHDSDMLLNSSFLDNFKQTDLKATAAVSPAHWSPWEKPWKTLKTQESWEKLVTMVKDKTNMDL